MRVALAILLALVPAAGLADTVEDRYGPPPPSHRAMAPAPVSYPTHAQAEAASAAVSGEAAGYRGRYLNWSSKAGLRGAVMPAQPGPPLAAAQAPRPQAMASATSRPSPYLRGPQSLNERPNERAGDSAPQALPQNLYDRRSAPALRGSEPAAPTAYQPPQQAYQAPQQSYQAPARQPQQQAYLPPRPARAAPVQQSPVQQAPVQAAAAQPAPRIVQSPPARLYAAAPAPQPAYQPPARPTPRPAQSESVASARVPTTPVQSAAIAPAQPRQVAVAKPVAPKPAPAAAAQTNTAPPAQVAAVAAPPPNAPWAVAHVRFYSLHRDYGDTPDPIPAQPARGPVLVGPGDGAAMPEDAPASPGRATSPTAGLF